MKKLLSVCYALIFILLSAGLSLAHEPIFGMGAHTLYKGGYGVEVEYEQEKAGSEKESAFDYHISYGVTPNFTIGIAVPQIVSKEENGKSSSGMGDLSLISKYRFIRFDEPGATTGVALNLGLKMPSGDETRNPPLGTGSTGYLVGLAVSRESLRHYFFADFAYRMSTQVGNTRKGNLLTYDIAYGIRPWHTMYLKPDLVFVMELNGEREEKTRVGKVKDAGSGGDRIFASPGVLLSYRNVMVKGGVQIPVSQNLNGNREKIDYRAVLSVELHL